MNLGLNIAIATEAILHNKLRTLLTSLGIIFGVGSVIAMLSVGKGAEQEIMEQMKALGANNVIVKPIIEQQEAKVEKDPDKKKKKKWSPGLRVSDIDAIRAELPGVEYVSPEIVVECLALHNDKKRSTKLVGVDSAYFAESEASVVLGTSFTTEHIVRGSPVCIIGWSMKSKLFAAEDPIGKQLKCDDLWLTVVGVIDDRKLSEATLKHLGIRDRNLDVYSPYTTVLRRFRNRSLLTKRMLNDAAREDNDEEKTLTAEERNYHQVDKIIIHLRQSSLAEASAEVVSRMLQRRHNGVVDYEIVVPELLLRQEQRTKDIFNVVLGAIAGISLIVGGIGIMNIMLASVLERTKEIGTRRALGATQRDIIIQFLSEAIALSLGGGILGVALGVGLSIAIRSLAGVQTVISPFSIIVSFSVAAAIGLVFGILPARRAATMDPIVALRYE